ncbi:MAG: BMP family protein [Chloroflexi bacterium]|jgi:basic membrane protein A|nr:BMP family protein [Chloroflexota bacterium]
MRHGSVRLAAVAAISIALLAACSGSGATNAPAESQAPAESAAPSAAALKVALVLPGPASDKGFNQSAYEALAELESKFGAETAYTESVAPNEFETAYRDYAGKGFNVIIGQGFEFGDIAAKVAPDYPDVKFLVTNNNALSGPNAEGLQPKSQDAAYLAGVVAGMATKSGKVGGIAGMQFPVIVAQMEAYKLGVLSVRPDAQVTLTYLGTFDDVAKAKETTQAMIDSGIDVIYHIADAAGVGVIQAADAGKILVIGWGKDQSELAPNAVVTSQIVDQKEMIVEAIGRIVNGQFAGEPQFFGLDTPVLGLAPIGAVDTDTAAKIQAKVDEVEAAILSGTTEVPFIPEPSN